MSDVQVEDGKVEYGQIENGQTEYTMGLMEDAIPIMYDVHDQEEVDQEKEMSETRMDIAQMDDPMPVTEEGDDVNLVIRDQRVPYDIVLLEHKYGLGERGVVANRDISAGDGIQTETIHLYVSSISRDDEYANGKFFTHASPVGDFECVKEELRAVPGNLHIALTCIIIKKYENFAIFFLDPEGGYHGSCSRDETMYASPKVAYLMAITHYFSGDDDFLRAWPLERFAKLYGVIQRNAIRGVFPLSSMVFGLGMFPSASFFNHSCTPNAILSVLPGRTFIQAIEPIKAGDEITISYKEAPADVLCRNLVHKLHYESGLVNGCRCELCGTLDEGRPDEPDSDERNIEILNDLKEMWTMETEQRISGDPQLKAYVLSMMRGQGTEEGAAAASAIRQTYSHFFDPEDPESYCHDLAFVLGHMYCSGTNYVAGQYAEDYLWWPNVFLNAVKGSRFKLMDSTMLAILAIAFSHVAVMSTRKPEENELRRKDITNFIGAWVALKGIHMSLFEHHAFLSLPLTCIPVLAQLVVGLSKHIKNLEDSIALQQLSAQTAEGENINDELEKVDGEEKNEEKKE